MTWRHDDMVTEEYSKFHIQYNDIGDIVRSTQEGGGRRNYYSFHQ